MTAKFGSESSSVKNPILDYVSQATRGLGWEFISRDEAEDLRHGIGGWFLYDVLRQKLLDLNQDFLDGPLADQVIKKMESVHPSIDGNRELLLWLRGQRSIYHGPKKRELNVSLIDFDHPDRNAFQVTEEWEFSNGRCTNRADLVFLINGVPVVIVETKSPREQEGMATGIHQIRRYHEETPELMTACQIFDVSNLLDWFYGVTWNTDRKNIFNWRDEEAGVFEDKVKAFFQRERILKFILHYILFIKRDDELNKFILRQHQTRGIEAVLGRARDPEKRTGLIWHTQGSGKTFTMITAALMILREPSLEKPTVLMVVDRNELETQLFQNLESYGLGDVAVARSKSHLRDLLGSDRRGLIVSMIHKFEGIPEKINERENIFVLIDEAHRSTGGDLGNFLMGALPNAKWFGFTGTPIDKTAHGEGTFKTFGKDDAPKGYLDKYNMAESIDDGTTLKLHYSLAPNEMRVDEETLEREFLSLAQAQGMSDIDELNKILERAVTLRTQMKAQDRVDKIAAFIASHYRNTVEPMGYKAFVVTVDREACALYKKALDCHLPAEYSRVVYTGNHNDSALLKEFHLQKQEEKEIRKAFRRKKELPKILIVTDKLLTGYDAPILYCMYMDKPMRDHVLLQAIARVNRPYEGDSTPHPDLPPQGRKESGAQMRKPAGLVVDFVGIFDKLNKALAFDSDEVASVIEDIQLLKETFSKNMAERAPEYLALVQWGFDDKASEAGVEYFHDPEMRSSFFKFFRSMESLYEIISPDPFLRPYLEDYSGLARLYVHMRRAFSNDVYVDREFLAKTASLVRENVSIEDFGGATDVHNLDEDTIAAIKRSKKSDRVKVINLIKSVHKTVAEEGGENPLLISIGARADEVAEMFYSRQIDSGEALDELAKLVKEYNEAKKEWERKGMQPNAFVVFWLLKKEGMDDPEALACQIDKAFQKHPHWRENPKERTGVKMILYRILLKKGNQDKTRTLIDHIITLRKG